MGGDDNVLSGFKFRNNVLFIVGSDTFECGFETLRPFIWEVESSVPFDICFCCRS